MIEAEIEENIEIAVDEMIKGNKYLEQASNYAIERRATKFRNILIKNSSLTNILKQIFPNYSR